MANELFEPINHDNLPDGFRPSLPPSADNTDFSKDAASVGNQQAGIENEDGRDDPSGLPTGEDVIGEGITGKEGTGEEGKKDV